MSLLSFFGSYFVKYRLQFSNQLFHISTRGWIWMCIRLLVHGIFRQSARVDLPFLSSQGSSTTGIDPVSCIQADGSPSKATRYYLLINLLHSFSERRLFYFLLSSTLFVLFKNFRISWRFISVFHGKKKLKPMRG